MPLRLLLDMNISPEWEMMLTVAGWETRHWSTLGDPRAADADILRYAAQHEFVILTRDLDFGIAVVIGELKRPSIIQLRTQSALPSANW